MHAGIGRRGAGRCLSSPIPADWTCRECGHPYLEHRGDVGCTHLMERIGGPAICRCRCFALPQRYLEARGMWPPAGGR
jgi:hypothetical protein